MKKMILRRVKLIKFIITAILFCLVSCNEDLSLLVHEKEISKRKKAQLFSVKYPEFKNNTNISKRGCDSINHSISFFINHLINEMECDQESEKDYTSRELKIDYDLDIFAGDYVSAKFRVYKYRGGAHGMTYFKCFNYNVQDALELKLGDVFHVDNKTEIQALNKLLLKYFSNPENCFDEIPEVTSAFESFSYQEDFFIFSFSDYSLGPYVCGTAEIKIPVWDIKQHGLLKLK